MRLVGCEFERLEKWPSLPLCGTQRVGIGGVDRRVNPRRSIAAAHRSPSNGGEQFCILCYVTITIDLLSCMGLQT